MKARRSTGGADRRPLAGEPAAGRRAAATASGPADRLFASPRLLAQRQANAALYGTGRLHHAVAQREGLTRKQVQAVDQRAWQIALAATAPIRPRGQQAQKINRGVDDDQDASTRVYGAGLNQLEVTYYQDNDSLSQADEGTRLGQMTALFNHELAYHGSSAVVHSMRNDQDDPDDEHLSMFDPARREALVATTQRALDAMDDLHAQLTYIDWWESDMKTHIQWADADDLRPRQRREAAAWAAQTASALRQRVEARHDDA